MFEIHTNFKGADHVVGVDIEPVETGADVYVRHHAGNGTRAVLLSLSDFDLIAAEVATFRRLNAEAAEQERNAA